jgi:serine/threonine protein kinase
MVVADRYELETVVGRGGYGVVYRALDRRLGRPVAVKVLSPGAAADPNVVERMVREQQAMVALAGTQAVSAVDLCRLPSGALCLVMEWLEGEDLEQHLSRLEADNRRMDPARLLQIVGAVADTLGKAHDIGIVHRDVKPANVFLMSNDPDGVRLLDFGLSRMKSAATLTAVGTVMGSPSYIAPESWRGNSKLVDHRVDVYSLGVITFRALAGRNPFNGGSLLEQLELVTSAPRPSLHALRPELRPEIDAWVEQALAIDPDRRFRTVHALHEALGEVLDLNGPRRPADAAPKPFGAVQVQNAIDSALRAARQLFQRFQRGGEASPEIASVGSEPPRVPQHGPEQKSFIAEWLAGTELKAVEPAGEPAADVLNPASGSAGHAGPRARPTAGAGSRCAPVAPPVERRPLGPPPRGSERTGLRKPNSGENKAGTRLATKRPWLEQQPATTKSQKSPKTAGKRGKRKGT